MEQTAMTDEIWKDIEGCGGVYMVSNMGRVKNCQRNKVLKNQVASHGYFCVSLTINGTNSSHLVHRLVAMAFLPNPDGLPYVNHVDENKLNPRVSNLEWCTPSHNAKHSLGLLVSFTSPSGVTYKAASLREFAANHSLDETCLSRVFRGISKQHKGWVYAQ